MSRGLRALQPYLANSLPSEPGPETLLCGLIGDYPSHYSRSPVIWNAAFAALGLDALYVPLDVSRDNLAALLAACRVEPRWIGANITFPYKQAVIPLLDELDSNAQRVRAVNTIARTQEGWLTGANTDGRGAVDSLIRPWSAGLSPLVERLDRRSVLLIGAGGAGRAVGFALAEAIGPDGHLFIANRTPETALELGEAIGDLYGNAHGMDEADAEVLAPGLDLVVNASTRGQIGWFPAKGGRITYLEPFSALGPADPPSIPDLPKRTDAARLREWLPGALREIQVNHAASMRFMLGAEPLTAFFDLIYAPAETMMLRHARWTGHATLNGQGMILFQAVAAFCDHIVRSELARRALDPEDTRRAVLEAMAAAWGVA